MLVMVGIVASLLVLSHKEIWSMGVLVPVILVTIWLWYYPAWWGKIVAVVFGGLMVLSMLMDALGVKTKTEEPGLSRSQAPGIDDGWYYSVDGYVFGPVTSNDLLDLLSNDHIPPDTPVRYGNSPWLPANEVISMR